MLIEKFELRHKMKKGVHVMQLDMETCRHYLLMYILNHTTNPILSPHHHTVTVKQMTVDRSASSVQRRLSNARAVGKECGKMRKYTDFFLVRFPGCTVFALKVSFMAWS